MKNNLVYIITLITIVIALNYVHIHTDPYPDYDHASDVPFFLIHTNQEIADASVPIKSSTSDLQDNQERAS